MSDIRLRKLTLDDFEAYARLRFLALETDPASFWGTIAEEKDILKGKFEARVTGVHGFILGAFSEDQLVGMMAFVREHLSKIAHKGGINGVYVHPDFRRFKIARQLLDRLLTTAFGQDGLRKIVLTVTAGNEPAKTLYEKYGFKEFGFEPDGMTVDGVSYDQHWMQLEKQSWKHESL